MKNGDHIFLTKQENKSSREEMVCSEFAVDTTFGFIYNRNSKYNRRRHIEMTIDNMQGEAAICMGIFANIQSSFVDRL